MADLGLLPHFTQRDFPAKPGKSQLPHVAEADKVYCGQKHFEALGVDFKVVTGAGEV